jgi:hypothetical protein
VTISIPSANRLAGLVLLALLGVAGQAQALCVDGTTTTCTLNGLPGTRECVNGFWTPCDTGVPPPPPLSAPTLPSRSATAIGVNWSYNVQSGEQYRLQHQVGASWVNLTFVGSPLNYVHSGLQPDSKHCYRIQATGTHGTRNSSGVCRYTTDGTTRKAARIQVEFHTGNVEDAGTDDSISVLLNDPGTNSTWVDYGRDDFERNDTFTYDLGLERIEFLSDITRIRLQKVGTDGWCLADFRLLVNGQPVYQENFHSLPGGCRWIDGNDGHQPFHEVPHATLRANAAWQSYMEPPFFSLDISAYPLITATVSVPRIETESRIESMMGDLIHGTQAHWGDRHGPRYVEASWGGFPQRLDVDLDLEASVDYWWDPELDIDFDLKFDARCINNQAVVDITTENLTANVDFDWFVELWSFILPCGPIATVVNGQPIPDCISALENYIGDRIEAGFAPIVQSQAQSLPPGYTCLSGSVVIDSEANVDLVFQIQAPAPPPPPGPRPTPFPTPLPPPRR